MRVERRISATSLVLAPLLLATAANAATLTVGPGPHPTLAAAVAAANPGDTLHLPAGEFYECAVLNQPNLVLEGEGDATVITDRTCEGKALLVIRGDRTTIRNLVLARARVPDGNGAGIRLEAQGLQLDHVRFRNNEVGVLAGQGGPGTLRIQDCTFEGGGVPFPRPAAALNVGPVALLQIDRTTFTGIKGAQISTAAAMTEITASTIDTGAEPGPGPAVTANGEALRIESTTLAIGPHAPPRGAAILALSGAVSLRDTTLLNASGAPATLLLDWTTATPALAGNHLRPGDREVGSDGKWRNRASTTVHAIYDGTRHLAGVARRSVLGVFR